MEKEKVFQILKELAKNKKPMNNLGMEDYGYLVNEHEIECFSHSSSTDELVIYNPQIQISAESETKRSIFRKRDKTKRSKKESAQHSKSRNKSFVMTSVSAL